MANISDIIEQFILSTIGNDTSIFISRNQLAQHFDCAPSQINYVLSTRFTSDRGFLIGSKRGGGGYIEIIKVGSDTEPYLNQLISEGLGGEISIQRSNHIADRLLSENVIDIKEYNIITAVLSDKALQSPFPIKDKLRAQILKNIIEALIKE
jgi:transcriptional regulator CtsR